MPKSKHRKKHKAKKKARQQQLNRRSGISRSDLMCGVVSAMAYGMNLNKQY